MYCDHTRGYLSSFAKSGCSLRRLQVYQSKHTLIHSYRSSPQHAAVFTKRTRTATHPAQVRGHHCSSCFCLCRFSLSEWSMLSQVQSGRRPSVQLRQGTRCAGRCLSLSQQLCQCHIISELWAGRITTPRFGTQTTA